MLANGSRVSGAPGSAPAAIRRRPARNGAPGDPFLRKSLAHFHQPILPSVDTPRGGLRPRDRASRLSLTRLADSLDPLAHRPGRMLDRSQFVPRNMGAQLVRISQKLAPHAAGQKLVEDVRALLVQETRLAEEFHGQRRQVIPC